MADKKIIINNVDVSRCECHNPNIKMDCSLYPLQPDACKNNPNCHYKNWQRKEQECKDLREDIKDIANLLDLDTGEEYNFGNIELEIKQLKAKEQECEYWKHQAELGVDTTNRLTKELEEKEQECEVLTLDARELDKHLQHRIEMCDKCSEYLSQLKAENEELKRQLESTKGLVTVGNKKLKEYLKENINLKVRKERYCQTLSDIQDEARDGYCSGTQTGCENSLHKILQKINECEGDNEV